MAISSRTKNRLINLALFLGVFLIIICVYLGVFSRFKKNLNKSPFITLITFPEEVNDPLSTYDKVQLGRWHNSARMPKSSYLNFPKKKAADKIRIGVFGCSFVFGLEAPEGFDFPTQLQHLYRESGREDIEVINFGVSSFGMNRSYYLWKALAQDYDLDLTIFNVHSFHIPRDNTFLFHNNAYGPIHCRYFIENGELKLLPVSGKSFAESSAAYYSPFPSLKYWRYDKRTPAPFLALLPEGRELKRNPFYYHPQPEEEWKELYQAIFDSVAHSSKQLILTVGDQEMNDFITSLQKDNISHVKIQAYDLMTQNRNLYSGVLKHPSALGYQAVAKEVYAYLEGDSSVTFPVIDQEFIAVSDSNFNEGNQSFSSLESVHLSIEEQELAAFFIPKRYERISFETGADSALIFCGDKSNLMSFQIQKSLKAENQLSLTFKEDGQEKTVSMGSFKA